MNTVRRIHPEDAKPGDKIGFGDWDAENKGLTITETLTVRGIGVCVPEQGYVTLYWEEPRPEVKYKRDEMVWLVTPSPMRVENETTGHNRALRFYNLPDTEPNDGRYHKPEITVSVKYTEDSGVSPALVLDRIIIPAIIAAINGKNSCSPTTSPSHMGEAGAVSRTNKPTTTPKPHDK